MEDVKPIKRARGPELIARRRAQEISAPFVAYFGEWNARAAHLTAIIGASATTENERLHAHRDRIRLAAEIRLAQRQFAAVQEDETPHARFVELDASFRRLLELLAD